MRDTVSERALSLALFQALRMCEIEKMAAKQQPRLRRVLGRFRRNELPGAVRWLLGNDDTPGRCTKRDIVASTLEAFVVSKIR